MMCVPCSTVTFKINESYVTIYLLLRQKAICIGIHSLTSFIWIVLSVWNQPNAWVIVEDYIDRKSKKEERVEKGIKIFNYIGT